MELFCSSSDNETTPKYKKIFKHNINANFNTIIMKRYEIIIKEDNGMYNFRTTTPEFVLTSFQHFLDSKFDRLSLQQIEFEMDPAGYPDNYNFFELGYCGHPQFLYSKTFFDQASDLILSQFQDEDHPFISEANRAKNIHLVLLYYVYKPKTDTSRTKNTNEDVNTYEYDPLYGGESTGFHCHMI